MLDTIFLKLKRFIPTKYRWILDHEGFRRYFANTGWMFFGQMFSLVVAFFVGIWLARYLGPQNYGLFSYVISFVGLFGFLASFGIDSIVSREIIKNHDKKDEIIGTGFYLKIIGGALAMASVFIVSFFITRDFFTLELIWIFSLNFILQAFNIIEIYFQSQVLSKKVVIAQITAGIISAILKILLIISGKGILWLIIVCLAETSVYASVLLFAFRKFGNHIRKWRFNGGIAKSLLKDSWPLMLSSVAVGIYMKIDQVMVKNMLGNEQSGIYAVAVKLSEMWYFIPVFICTSLSPAIIKAASISKELFEGRMKKLYFLMFWLAVLVALFMTIFAYPIIKILFGAPYMGAVTTLRIYAWAGISVSMGVAVGQYIIANNLAKISFYTTMLGAITNVFLNVLLIPRMGIAGAAVATIIAYFVANFGILIFKKSRDHGFLVLKSVISYK